MQEEMKDKESEIKVPQGKLQKMMQTEQEQMKEEIKELARMRQAFNEFGI